MMKATPKRYEAFRATLLAAGADIDRLTAMPKSHRYPCWLDDLNDASRRYVRLSEALDRFGFMLAREKRAAMSRNNT